MKYPIGIQDFRKIREGSYLYIDKTELIYELLSRGSNYFLTRPRRFGKSLLISTSAHAVAGRMFNVAENLLYSGGITTPRSGS